MEVPLSEFLDVVVTLFGDSTSDRFYLDGVAYPLSEKGAQDCLEEDHESPWSLMWGTQPITAVRSALLQKLSVILGVPLTFDAKEARVAVREHVQVAVEPEGQWYGGPFPTSLSFYLVTTGLEQFGRTNLEMRGVPALFVSSAIDILRQLAATSLIDPMEDGDVFRFGDVLPLLLQAKSSPNRGTLGITIHQILIQPSEKVIH